MAYVVKQWTTGEPEFMDSHYYPTKVSAINAILLNIARKLKGKKPNFEELVDEQRALALGDVPNVTTVREYMEWLVSVSTEYFDRRDFICERLPFSMGTKYIIQNLMPTWD